MRWTYEEYNDSIIARGDGGDMCDAFGWVALVRDGKAYLARYGHCSCYGTFESLLSRTTEQHNELGSVLTFDWEGDVSEMISLANMKKDPSMPERESAQNDYDYVELMTVYDNILKWARQKGISV